MGGLVVFIDEDWFLVDLFRKLIHVEPDQTPDKPFLIRPDQFETLFVVEAASFLVVLGRDQLDHIELLRLAMFDGNVNLRKVKSKVKYFDQNYVKTITIFPLTLLLELLIEL